MEGILLKNAHNNKTKINKMVVQNSKGLGTSTKNEY